MKKTSEKFETILPRKIGKPLSFVMRFGDDTFLAFDLNNNMLMEEDGCMPLIFEDFHIETPHGMVHRVLGSYYIDDKPCTEEVAYSCLKSLEQIPLETIPQFGCSEWR